MNRIRILPDQVANQIAAGEVIERPASVLKELVENAIDAQATSIRIEISGGGKSLIRVSDNGHGMGRDDALLCIERHATSKIHDSADIGAIHTLGFRGEAIPSIASVSRFRLLSRETDATVGVELKMQGGKLLEINEASCQCGTQMEVRNLFYNLPARRKFLRSDTTEIGHLYHVFLLHALAQSKIAWVLQQEARMIHQLAPSITSESSDPQTALLNRVRALYGTQLISQLVAVSLKKEFVTISGLIGKPGLSRSNRSELYCFVNSRPVDSRAIYYGLLEGYRTSLMKGRYPVCFLFLEVDPVSVDVNIHPAKREVRFRDDARIQGAVVEAVRKALGIQLGNSAAPSPLAMSLSSSRFQAQPSTVPIPSLPTGETFSSKTISSLSPVGAELALGLQPLKTDTTNISITGTQPQSPQSVSRSSFSILGVFANLYVIAADEEGLMIVDQHAAHERILFEQMMSRLLKGSIPSQRLLIPQTVELSPKDALELQTHLSLLEKMGFGISEFGDRNFIVDALPAFLKTQAIAQIVRSIVDELKEAGRGINRDRFAEETVAKTVCRHAVKANDILRMEELHRLIIDLQACVHPLTCPHGRPTILRLTRNELEKKFGRRTLDSP